MAKHRSKNTYPRASVSLGFVFVSALVMVTAVDPYSGAFASADTMQNFDVEDMQYQQLTIQPIAGNGFGRGEFELVDGATALRSIVRNAPIPDVGSAKASALVLTTARGWEYAQFSCLVKLWERESNWKLTATNPSSGAYGIPQSLPASKMASAGADWRTNAETQIKWGIGYIEGRYGSPCAALAHSDENNWY